MKREHPPANIQSYLLRIWYESADDNLIPRLMLTDINTGKRQGFPTLEAAFQHLTAQIQNEA